MSSGPSPRVVATVYIVVVSILGTALLWHALATEGVRLDGTLLVLTALAVLSWWGGTNVVEGRVYLSFSNIILLAAMAMTGPAGAGLVGVATGALQRDRIPVRARLFNTAMTALLGVIGGHLYAATGGMRDTSDLVGIGEFVTHLGYPLMVAESAQVVVNVVLISGIIRITDGVPVRVQAGRMISMTGLAYLGYGIIAFLLVVLWQPAGLGAFSAVLILPPLLVARWAYVQYAEERRAHGRALGVLVAALEAKAPHLAGHSRRVAELCASVGEALGLRPRELSMVRTAGMLHDIGQVTLPTAVVRGAPARAGQPNLDSYPERGLDVLAGLTFLEEALDPIAGHARTPTRQDTAIVGVVDRFDLLTSGGAGERVRDPDSAIAELRSKARTIELPVLDALERVLARRGPGGAA